MMSWVWKLLKKEDDTGNCVAFLKFSDINVQSIYSISFPLLRVHATQEILTFLYSK